MMPYTSPVFDITENRRWQDVHLEVEADNAGRMLGMVPTPEYMLEGLRDYEDVYASLIYPRSEWEDRIEQADRYDSWPSNRIVYPHDQDGEGTCVYNMLALMMQIAWNQTFGDHLAVQFSPMSGYRWNASGPNSGSYVGGSATWAESKGLLPTDRLEVKALLSKYGQFAYHPNVGWREPFEANWQTTARLFRTDEWLRISTVEGWVSAILNGHPCGGGRNSHAICHCRLAMDNGKLYSVYCNSWGPWGATINTPRGPLKSFGFDSESLIRTMVSREGFCVRNMVVGVFGLLAA